MDAGAQSTSTPEPTPTGTPTATPTPTPTLTPEPEDLQFGEYYRIGLYELTITRVEPASTYDDDVQGVKLFARARNPTDEAVEAPYWGDFLLVTESEQWTPLNVTSFDSDRILPDRSMEGYIKFEIPQDVSLDTLNGAFFPDSAADPYIWIRNE